MASFQNPPYRFHDSSSVGGAISEAVEDELADISPAEKTGNGVFLAPVNGSPKEHRWQAQKRDRLPWINGVGTTGPRRGRQKSLSEAIRTIRERRASVTENAHEIAEALKAPVSPRLVLLCGFWYMTSIFSNASSKAILTAFRYPVTLTLVQFFFVSSWCIASSWLAYRFPSLQAAIPPLRYKICLPSRELIMTTLPLTAFQIGGHVMNSDAMSRIPVSLVHTIKGLSPLFTVLAYRLVFGIKYSSPTYWSLVPLTLGVVMACRSAFSGDAIGLLGAFGSAILFVTQNIVSKKLFTDAARAEADGLSNTQITRKPDKLNLLCYSSGLALVLIFPLWLWSEGFVLLHDLFFHGSIELSSRPDRLDSNRLALEFIFNGTFHFAQSLVAFQLLSMVSPVTYSVASLIKRVFVIVFAIVWFGNPMTRVQAAGIALTFVGLYLYDRNNDAARGDLQVRKLQARADGNLLPLATRDLKSQGASTGRLVVSPMEMGNGPSPGALWPPISEQHPHQVSPSRGHSLRPTDALTRRESDSSRKGGSLSNGSAVTPENGWRPSSGRQDKSWPPQDLTPKSNGVAI